MKPSPPVVFVHEFFTGGGWTEATLPPPGLAAEARIMLQAILADFRAWGHVKTVTTLDWRLSDIHLPADRIIKLRPAEYWDTITKLCAQSQAALIIAPEQDNLLAQLTALVEQADTPLLGANSAAVAAATNKWESYRRFQAAGLPCPETWYVSSTEAPAAARQLGLPLVVKPVNGVGCEGVSRVTDNASLHLALAHPAVRQKELLLQQYLSGTHASVSLLVADREILPLSLNKQHVEVDPVFNYLGGQVPLQHPLQTRAFDVAQQAVAALPGLRGYVGVDVILTATECYLIEINSRLTTSYIGLRQVINLNLAQAIWQACAQNLLPQNVRLSGNAAFRKDDVAAVEITDR